MRSALGFSSSCKVILIILDYFLFRNSAPSSTSAADAATNFIIWHRVNIAPLRCMGCLSCGFHTRKKCPATRILEYLSDNYYASELIFSIMSEA